MQIIIQSPHIKLTEGLIKFVNNKVDKLTHFYDKIESAEVFLKIEKSDSTDEKVCEIRLAIPGNDLFVKKQSNTFEDAVSTVVNILQGEIIRAKINFKQ